MTLLNEKSVIRSEVVSDPSIMSGDPVVRGTRILAETIASYLRDGHTAQQIFEDYPSLPVDGIDAVSRWAEATMGLDWKSRNQPRSSTR